MLGDTWLKCPGIETVGLLYKLGHLSYMHHILTLYRTGNKPVLPVFYQSLWSPAAGFEYWAGFQCPCNGNRGRFIEERALSCVCDTWPGPGNSIHRGDIPSRKGPQLTARQVFAWHGTTSEETPFSGGNLFPTPRDLYMDWLIGLSLTYGFFSCRELSSPGPKAGRCRQTPRDSIIGAIDVIVNRGRPGDSIFRWRHCGLSIGWQRQERACCMGVDHATKL